LKITIQNDDINDGFRRTACCHYVVHNSTYTVHILTNAFGYTFLPHII